jgi:hypothetical protein
VAVREYQRTGKGRKEQVERRRRRISKRRKNKEYGKCPQMITLLTRSLYICHRS